MPQLPATPTPARAGATAPSLHEPGALRFNTDREPWQRSLRWTAPARDRRLLLLGGLIAVALTVLQLVGFAVAMRSHRPWSAPHRNDPIQVVLLETEPEVPPPPEPEPPIVARPSRVAIAPPEVKKAPPPPRHVEDSGETQARIGSAGAAAPPAEPPQPQLFNPDGSIRLNAQAAPVIAPKAPENPREAAKARWAQIEQRNNPLDCRKTRFSQAFAPDESAGDKLSRKYLKWVGLSDPEAIARRNQQRAEAGGCEPAR
jgi:hypothetical protein